MWKVVPVLLFLSFPALANECQQDWEDIEYKRELYSGWLNDQRTDYGKGGTMGYSTTQAVKDDLDRMVKLPVDQIRQWAFSGDPAAQCAVERDRVLRKMYDTMKKIGWTPQTYPVIH